MAGAGIGFATLRLSNTAEAKRNHHKKHKKRKMKSLPPTSPPPSSPDLTTRVDATCSELPGANKSGAANPDRDTRYAQTFTPLASGLLVTAQLPIIKKEGSVGDFILRLVPVDGSGIPTNGVLAETTVANADVVGGSLDLGTESPVTFRFGAPASVEAGSQYSLVLTRPSDPGTWVWTGDLANPCAGRSFQSPNQTEPFAVIAGGIGFDFTFMTFVSS